MKMFNEGIRRRHYNNNNDDVDDDDDDDSEGCDVIAGWMWSSSLVNRKSLATCLWLFYYKLE